MIEVVIGWTALAVSIRVAFCADRWIRRTFAMPRDAQVAEQRRSTSSAALSTKPAGGANPRSGRDERRHLPRRSDPAA